MLNIMKLFCLANTLTVSIGGDKCAGNSAERVVEDMVTHLIPIGHQLMAECAAYNYAYYHQKGQNLSFAWYKKLKNGTFTNLSPPKDETKEFWSYRYTRDAKLHILGVQKAQHDGVYYCRVQSENCNKFGSYINLTVKGCDMYGPINGTVCARGSCALKNYTGTFQMLMCECFEEYSGPFCESLSKRRIKKYIAWYPFSIMIAILIIGLSTLYLCSDKYDRSQTYYRV